MTLTGSLADINTALNGLTFSPTANAHGAASVSITTSDQGYSGLGGTLTDSDAVSITVTSINDAPAGADRTVTTVEDTPYTFTTSDFGFSDSSDSPANGLLSVRISSLPGAGTLTNNGLAVTLGQSITLAEISAGTLVFTPAAYASGTAYASFTFQVQDDGGTAIGGQDRDLTPNTITLDVTSVNEGPLPEEGPTDAGAWEIDHRFATFSPESLATGQVVEIVKNAQYSSDSGALPRDLEWRHGGEGYWPGEMRSIRDIDVSLANLEAIVANALQDHPVEHATRLSSSPTLPPHLGPAADDIVGTVDGGLLLPEQDGEPDPGQEENGFSSFVVGATSAAPITMSIGYAIWLLSEESIVAQRLLPLVSPTSPRMRSLESKAETF